MSHNSFFSASELPCEIVREHNNDQGLPARLNMVVRTTYSLLNPSHSSTNSRACFASLACFFILCSFPSSSSTSCLSCSKSSQAELNLVPTMVSGIAKNCEATTVHHCNSQLNLTSGKLRHFNNIGFALAIGLTKTPVSIVKIPIPLPGHVIGKRSPYPTVVTVTITHQNASGISRYLTACKSTDTLSQHSSIACRNFARRLTSR